jgi:FkbM family methyltransferase
VPAFGIGQRQSVAGGAALTCPALAHAAVAAAELAERLASGVRDEARPGEKIGARVLISRVGHAALGHVDQAAVPQIPQVGDERLEAGTSPLAAAGPEDPLARVDPLEDLGLTLVHRQKITVGRVRGDQPEQRFAVLGESTGGCRQAPRRLANGRDRGSIPPMRQILRQVWHAVPEGPLKERLRLLRYNRTVRTGVRYRLVRGAFEVEMDGVRFRVEENPIGLDVDVDRYQARHRVMSGEIVLDAGASMGHVTLYLAQHVGCGGRVIAVEPDDHNRAQLHQNLRLNPTVENVTVLDPVLWDAVGTIEFCEQGSFSSSSLWMPADQPKVRKPAITIDALVSSLSLPRVDFIKMDIEGAEMRAIAGAAATIARDHPAFAVATYHVIDGARTFGRVEAALREFGYTAETISYGHECLTYGTWQ